MQASLILSAHSDLFDREPASVERKGTSPPSKGFMATKQLWQQAGKAVLVSVEQVKQRSVRQDGQKLTSYEWRKQRKEAREEAAGHDSMMASAVARTSSNVQPSLPIAGGVELLKLAGSRREASERALGERAAELERSNIAVEELRWALTRAESDLEQAVSRHVLAEVATETTRKEEEALGVALAGALSEAVAAWKHGQSTAVGSTTNSSPHDSPRVVGVFMEAFARRSGIAGRWTLPNSSSRLEHVSVQCAVPWAAHTLTAWDAAPAAAPHDGEDADGGGVPSLFLSRHGSELEALLHSTVSQLENPSPKEVAVALLMASGQHARSELREVRDVEIQCHLPWAGPLLSSPPERDDWLVARRMLQAVRAVRALRRANPVDEVDESGEESEAGVQREGRVEADEESAAVLPRGGSSWKGRLKPLMRSLHVTGAFRAVLPAAPPQAEAAVPQMAKRPPVSSPQQVQAQSSE